MNTKALKDRILQLAIQGKLVSQDPNDEPASILLEKIKEEKERLIQEGKIRREKPLPPIAEDEKPFDLPKGWEWVRLGEIGITQTGTTPPTNRPEYFNGTIPFIKPADISDKGIDYNNESLTDLGLSKGRTILKNSVLMVCIGGSIGKCYYTDRECSCNQQINSFTPYIGVNYKLVYYFMLTSYFYQEILKRTTGSATPIINKNKWSEIAIPLPPLCEQKRILEKIDHLFKLIDELADNKEKLKELIKLTREKTLQLALQGKLVAQDPNDEPASVLLEKIKEEKESLIKEGKIKREKPLPPIAEDEKPFDLPKGWEWVRLGEISIINMGQSPDGKTVNDNLGMEFHQGKTFFGDKFLNRSDKYTTDFKKVTQEGDVVLSVRAPVGEVNITDRTICIGRGLCAISKLGEISNEYYYYFIKALKNVLIEKGNGTTFLAITKDIINEFIIPLPPLRELKRILEKINIITSLCDDLEKLIF